MKPNKTFIIRHKETKAQFHAVSGKTSWKATGHAKLAFHNSISGGQYVPSEYTLNKYALTRSDFKQHGGYDERDYRFDGQSVYEIVELKPKSEDQLQKAVELLKVVRQVMTNNDMYSEIGEFLKEVEIE